jgi:hypothetical protein
MQESRLPFAMHNVTQSGGNQAKVKVDLFREP